MLSVLLGPQSTKVVVPLLPLFQGHRRIDQRIHASALPPGGKQTGSGLKGAFAAYNKKMKPTGTNGRAFRVLTHLEVGDMNLLNVAPF